MSTTARTGTRALFSCGSLCLALAGCGATPSPPPDAGSIDAGVPSPDAGSIDAGALDAGPFDASLPSCGAPDRTCPMALPFSSAPCEGMIACTYPSGTASCAAGQWVVTPTCADLPPGAPCVPDLVESCEGPFRGMLSGATVSIGPYGSARAFGADEVIMPLVGGQGSPMLAWSLLVGGVEAPACVRTTLTVTPVGGTAVQLTQPITLHCGASRATLFVLPFEPCDPMQTYPVELRVQVEGVGEATARVRVQGIECNLRG